MDAFFYILAAFHASSTHFYYVRILLMTLLSPSFGPSSTLFLNATCVVVLLYTRTFASFRCNTSKNRISDSGARDL